MAVLRYKSIGLFYLFLSILIVSYPAEGADFDDLPKAQLREFEACVCRCSLGFASHVGAELSLKKVRTYNPDASCAKLSNGPCIGGDGGCSRGFPKDSCIEQCLDSQGIQNFEAAKTHFDVWSRKVRKAAPDPLRQKENEPITRRIDSGAGFSDISGNVSICPHDEDPTDEDNWDFVDLKTKIYRYDHIRTGEGSSAIIGFSDMSTFEMGAETEIMISHPPAQQGKLALVWGNIKMNFKKMLKDGSMDIEMNQAVAGIKGTRFECWERGATSQVAVYEGVVEVVSKSTGQTIDLNAGQEVIAAANGLFLPIGQDTKVKAIKKDAKKVFGNTNRNQASNTPPRPSKAWAPKSDRADQTEKRHQPAQSAPQDTSQSNPLAGKWLDPGTKGFWTFAPLPGGGYKAAYKGNIETQGLAWLQGRNLEIEFSVEDIQIRYRLTLSRDSAQARGSWRSSDGESEEAILIRTESGAPAQTGTVGNIRPGEKPRMLFENGNSGGVRNSPQTPTVITLTSPQLITRITTYHHNHGKGDGPGTLGLLNKQGRTYGPWRTLVQNPDGTPVRRYWTVAPMVVIPAGKYQVVDSNPATWSHNATSGSRGITWVEGVPR